MCQIQRYSGVEACFSDTQAETNRVESSARRNVSHAAGCGSPRCEHDGQAPARANAMRENGGRYVQYEVGEEEKRCTGGVVERGERQLLVHVEGCIRQVGPGGQ